MKEKTRDNEVEVSVGEIRLLGVLLTEMNWDAFMLGESMTVAQNRGGYVDSMSLGARKRRAVGQ